jgi:hypothetical protein
MKLETRKTKGVCGLNDMYGSEIERKFGVLEANASKVIKRIEDDFACGKKTTCLSRPDKDTLRRFLFIMHYRSRKFYHRFEKTAEAYDAIDRSLLVNYMRERGFATPREVWLDNLGAFLDVKLGHDSKRWESELMEIAYPDDAKWFCHHMNQFFLCFCRPEDLQDGFLLTQNAYGVFEGPNSEVGWTDWHNFAQISPKLLIVLRNIWIPPLPSDPIFDKTRNDFEKLVALHCSIYSNPASARSWLADLPVERPRYSYSSVQFAGNAKRRAHVKATCLSDDDTFEFKLFELPSSHVQKINSILLDNAPSTELIVFGARSALRRALEFYFQLEHLGFKAWWNFPQEMSRAIIGNDGLYNKGDFRKYLIGLEGIGHDIGSEVEVKYPVSKLNMVSLVPDFSAKFESRYRQLGQFFYPDDYFH